MSTHGPDEDVDWTPPEHSYSMPHVTTTKEMERKEKLSHGYFYIESPNRTYFCGADDPFTDHPKYCQRFLTEDEAIDALIRWAKNVCSAKHIPVTPKFDDYVKSGYKIKFIDLDEVNRLRPFMD